MQRFFSPKQNKYIILYKYENRVEVAVVTIITE